MPTKQETFDTVVAHLRKQGAKAEKDGFCKYRTPEGLKCAAGCLIPDSDYKEEFEGLNVGPNGQLTEIGVLIKNLGHDIDLVRRLQYIHDNIPMKYWEEEFESLAKKHGLEKKDAGTSA